jgi:23S rRNA pseudouridine2605 synthase
LDIRLQKLIAAHGYTSRRKAEKLITAGRVKVNGSVIDTLGTKIPEDSVVEVDGTVINKPHEREYLMLNKPPGYLCTRKDHPRNRPLVYDLLPAEMVEKGVYSVGRLDYYSEGLLLFTNDGDFAQAVGHPSGGIVKKYVIETSAAIPYNLIDSWINGIYIRGVRYRITGYEEVSPRKIVIFLSEGKNREIRRLFQHISLGIERLARTAVGSVELGDLGAGEWRPLTGQERSSLLSARRGADDHSG